MVRLGKVIGLTADDVTRLAGLSLGDVIGLIAGDVTRLAGLRLGDVIRLVTGAFNLMLLQSRI